MNNIHLANKLQGKIASIAIDLVNHLSEKGFNPILSLGNKNSFTIKEITRPSGKPKKMSSEAQKVVKDRLEIKGLAELKNHNIKMIEPSKEDAPEESPEVEGSEG